jgi:NADH dehydrogenase
MQAPISSGTGWRRGPVAITGASGQVGTALRQRLAALPNEVRPLGRDDDLAAAFGDAAVVVHLAGTLQPRKPNTYVAANLDTVRSVVAALAGSSVQRIVFLSFTTADAQSANAYLQAKGRAEAALRECGIPLTVFRCNHIYGPPAQPGPTAAAFLAKRGATVTVLGSGQQRLAPVHRDDVAEAITHAALDPSTPAGVFHLAGPETITAADFARRLNRGPVKVRPTPAPIARLLSRLRPALPAPLVDVMVADVVPPDDPQATAKRFGFALRRIEDTWPAPTTGHATS